MFGYPIVMTSATTNLTAPHWRGQRSEFSLKGQPLGELFLSLLSSRALTNIEDSDVYRMLQRDEDEPPHAPRQSGSFKALQDFVDSDGEVTLLS